MGKLDGKVAIISGAAKPAGIGFAIAKCYVEEGAKVALCDIIEDLGKESAASLGENAQFIRLDVTSEESWKAVFEKVVADWGKVDIVVNNAGVDHNDNAEEITLEDFHRVCAINLDGVVLGQKYGIQYMKDHGGSIINAASVGGLRALPTQFSYTATKGAVRMLTKSAALHCCQNNYNIRVNTVLPGTIKTDMLLNCKEGPDFSAQFEPIGRVGEPYEVAGMYLYLASDDGAYCTVGEYLVDGGYAL